MIEVWSAPYPSFFSAAFQAARVASIRGERVSVRATLPICYINSINPTAVLMAPQAIFGPFFATMFLTLIVWVYMYVRRIHFINSNRISPNDLAVPGALAQLTPAAVSNPSDNLKNLFEIPVLFYALALYLFVTSQVDAAYVYAGWTFVVFRALHSAVHCTFNLVLLRFWLYAISTAALWFIALRAALAYFGIL
jgi:hypothetical protein